MAWGLGRVAGLEHPERWGGLIDLPPVLDERPAGGPDAGLDERTGAWLCAVLAGCGEDQVAIRAGGLYVRRLARKPAAGRAPARTWRPTGTVLVTVRPTVF